MPTSSPMKRPSAGGRLGRLLASLRPPRRDGPLPVQTGFPTSLADLVVKNQVRLRNPTRHRHRTSVAPPAAVAEPPLPPPQSCEVLTSRNALVDIRPKGAGFSIRPELVLAFGGAVALALLVIWSKWLVAAASVALFWIDSVRASASRLRPRSVTEGLQVCVSPIRKAESSEAGTPTTSSCADSDEKGSEEVCAADTADLGGDHDSVTPKTKGKRRSSLRKLIPKKLRNGKRSSSTLVVVDFNKVATTTTGSLLQHPDDAAGEAVVNSTRPALSEPRYLPAQAADDTTTPPDAVAVEKGCTRKAGAFASFVPVVILVGLVAGKISAVALTVLCVVLFLSTTTDRVSAS